MVKTSLLENNQVSCELNVSINSEIKQLKALGNGPIDAAKHALSNLYPELSILSYSEHSLGQGSDSNAICYMTISVANIISHGVGLDTNITIASVKALFSALNRSITKS